MRRKVKNRLAQGFIAVISYLASFEAENSQVQDMLKNVMMAYEKCNFQDCPNGTLILGRLA